MKPLFGPCAVAVVAALLGFVGGNALAQGRPSQPILILAPLATGGASDVPTRLLNQMRDERMGSRSWSKTARVPATARRSNRLRGAR
jgi:tripartite-type tricarboxylate transporter receptor subunit TctC